MTVEAVVLFDSELAVVAAAFAAEIPVNLVVVVAAYL